MLVKQDGNSSRPPLRKSISNETADRRRGTQKLASPDRVVAAIVGGIRNGAYSTGQRLIEADLTRDLRVSRGPVREAFKRLAAEGVLTLTRHRGAYIRALSRAEVQDMLVVVEVLFGLMANLAANRIAENSNAARLRKAFERLRVFKDDGGSVAFVNERHRFYESISQIGGNQTLNRILPLMQLHLMRMQFQAYITPRGGKKLFMDYESITKAILSGDARRSEKAINLHIKRTRVLEERLPNEAYPQIQP